MKLGIVGLPNVGKSTLFNSLTKAGAESANYPFCTIDPNVGVVTVPDHRLDVLGEMYNTKKITPAAIEFVDIAGLVKGASKKDFQGHTTILRNSLFKLSSSGSRVKLENPDFEKTFDVYSTDQIEARYLLSPSMMERLLALDREFNRNITISFRDSNILIAIPESRNHFEASIWKPMDDLSQLKNDFSMIHALVSIVEDLNLNTRIWSKK